MKAFQHIDTQLIKVRLAVFAAIALLIFSHVGMCYILKVPRTSAFTTVASADAGQPQKPVTQNQAWLGGAEEDEDHHHDFKIGAPVLKLIVRTDGRGKHSMHQNNLHSYSHPALISPPPEG